MLPKQKAKYLAKAVATSWGTSSNGNYQIGVTVEVVEGEFAGSEITWLGHFTEKTQDRTIESLQNMGWKGDDLTELEALDGADCARVLPDHFEIACDVEVYEGNQQLKVKWINRPGAGRFAFKEKLGGSALKDFAAQMRGTIRGAQGGKPNGSAPTKPSGGYGGRGNGDTPF